MTCSLADILDPIVEHHDDDRLLTWRCCGYDLDPSADGYYLNRLADGGAA